MTAVSAPPSQRRPPESLSDYALRAIREDLIEGRLVAGQRVSPDELAQSLSISHVPVREALRFLEAEGHLVRTRSHWRVAPLSAAEGEQIYQLRATLEAEAHRRALPRMTEVDFEQLEQHFREMDAAAASGDRPRYARANRAFHFVVFDRSGDPWLRRFLTIVWDAAARYQTSFFRGSGWESALRSHHVRLIEAMRTRDAAALNDAMIEHRRLSVEASHTWVENGNTDDEADGEDGDAGSTTREG